VSDTIPSVPTALKRGNIFTILTNTLLVGTCVFVLWSYARETGPAGPEPPPIPSGPIRVDPDARLGSPHAPAVMVEFADFNCPDCRTFAREVLPAIKAEYVSTSHLELMFMHFPVSPPGLEPIKTALCAAEQDAFWPMHEKIFEFPAQSRPNRAALVSEVRLHSDAFDACIDGLTDLEPSRFHKWGLDLGLNATPSLFIGRRLSDGAIEVTKTFVGTPPLNALKDAINLALKR